MELITKKIEIACVKERLEDQFLLNDDYNVPDSKEDVKRIIASCGKLHVADVLYVENYVRITGVVAFRILYETDTIDGRLSALVGQIPFEELVYMQDGEETAFSIRDPRVELAVSVIHSRKLNVKAMVSCAVVPERYEEKNVTLDVEPDKGIYKKKKEIPMLKLYMAKKDTHRIKEELVLPGTKESIGEIIWFDIAEQGFDSRINAEGLAVEGNLQVFCFYESLDGKLEWMEQTIPYEGCIACAGCDEMMYHQVREHLIDTKLDVRMDEDGEMRVIGVEGTLQLELKIYEEEEVCVLEDAYSTECQLELETENTFYEEMLQQNHSKCKVTERLSLPELENRILQICHSSGEIQLEHMEEREDGILLEGVLHVQFLYAKSGEEISYDTWQGMVPFAHVVECENRKGSVVYDIANVVEQLTITLLGGNSVEVKAVLAFRSFVTGRVLAEAIVGVEEKPITPEELEKRPGIICCIVGEQDDLWSIAKRYGTSVESLKAVNGLEEEKIKSGERILIFRENVSIL